MLSSPRNRRSAIPKYYSLICQPGSKHHWPMNDSHSIQGEVFFYLYSPGCSLTR